MRVVFLTLLLGLVGGPQKVELAVEGAPAAVEILFDDEVVARLTAPPWVADLDFGPDPLPREVVARALDASGREVSRAVQRVNLPHEREALDITIESNAQGAPVAARVVWQSAVAESPSALSLALDGRPLDLEGDRALLPRLAPDAAHVLEARAIYESGTRATALLLGGTYVDRVATELVGVPVRVGNRRAVDAVSRCLTGPRGDPVEVQSVDEGGGEIFLVSSRESRYELRRGMLDRLPRTSGPLEPVSDLLRLKLPKGTRATFYWPELAPQSRDLGGGRRTDLFLNSGPLPLDAQGLWNRIGSIEPAATLPTAAPRLADTTGVAVFAAAGSGRPRVVVVVLAPGEADASALRPGQIRELARRLHVPLQVWSVGGPQDSAWGQATPLFESSSGLRTAHLALRDDLKSQRIAWVRSSTALHRIGLRADCEGLELAR